ncbi:hypothetical protein [Prevotella intermedia]|uniref:Uncharacterized protein n=1 Tax=Prevotella intermedia TaxID=28131 RepID=A0A2D3L7X5_PREIN|nr:hypothetical protein [Prevotella intermedia]ATV26643.1 hypothetical protein CTM62_07870 [Prevotella intermedia]
MEKKSFIKSKGFYRFLIGLFVVALFLFISYLLLKAYFPLQAQPGNQPELSSKEKEYFKEMKKQKGWEDIQRHIYNIDKDGESSQQSLVNWNKSYAYMFCAEIEDSTTFYSLPKNIEDSIVLHLYNYVIDKSSNLRKIVIIFNYEEDLSERASIGHSRAEEYEVHSKKIIKLKQAIK